MKADIYIYGNFEDGYSQYPDDYTKKLFSRVINRQKGETEIVYHRDGNLAFYTYIRRLSAGPKLCIGLCISLNDVLIKDFNHLYEIFEDTITYMAVSGGILEFTNNGDLTSTVRQLYLNADDFNRITEYVNSKLADVGAYSSKLPAINYSISIDEWKSYDYQQIDDIQKAIENYPYVEIIKDERYDSESLKGFSSKLKKLNKTIGEQTKEIDQLKANNAKLTRQKKQSTIVIILVVVIAIGVIFFGQKIQDKNSSIDELTQYSERLGNLNKQLEDQNNSLSNQLNKSKQDYSTLASKFDLLQKQSDKFERQSNVYRHSNDSLKKIVSQLRLTINNLGSTGSYSVGPRSYDKPIEGHDANYALWIKTYGNLYLKSFMIHPNKSGRMTIGLYSTNHQLLKSIDVNASENTWQTVYTNIPLSSNTTYYLAIVESNGISLSYHKSNDSEYKKYQSGSLRILGECTKGNKSYNTSYYQYFYNITYSLQ